ncbi:hypothetical protein LCGC14_1243980, partial [marine sediment metagenome]
PLPVSARIRSGFFSLGGGEIRYKREREKRPFAGVAL